MTNPFRTPITVKKLPLTIDYNSKLLALGSCFASNMGLRLKDLKFETMINPFGTLFHPLSILKLIRLALENDEPLPEHYLEWKGLCFHYDLHSDHFASNKLALQNDLKKLLFEVRNYIVETDVLLLTFGTAFIYRLKSSNAYVANCHKQAAGLFEKELSDPVLLQQEFEACYQLLKTCNPNLKIILSISPVRHIKDGISENTVSKSILHILRHRLCNDCEDVQYFPAYEMMIDDLRDYRFYKQDMLHPSALATDYIWDHFSKVVMDSETKTLMKNVSDIKQALDHKALHPKSTDHRIFLEKTLEKINRLGRHVDFSNETSMLQTKIADFYK